ncbi:MAG: methyltransferase domain-containing protein [Kouleothrix sp.]
MPVFSPLPRSEQPELLDQPTHDINALAANLGDLRALDRWLGSSALTWRGLWPMLRRLPPENPYTLLDVATGGADGPPYMAVHARRHGYTLHPIASDRLADVLQLARAAGVRFPLIRHDALHIPLPNGAVDFATCALALHHFAPAEAVALLRELARVARYGVVVNDLRRARPAYWGARLLALGPWHTMARHDGPLSVLRAYTLPEARALVAEASLRNAQVLAWPPFRLLITIKP